MAIIMRSKSMSNQANESGIPKKGRQGQYKNDGFI